MSDSCEVKQSTWVQSLMIAFLNTIKILLSQEVPALWATQHTVSLRADEAISTLLSIFEIVRVSFTLPFYHVVIL